MCSIYCGYLQAGVDVNLQDDIGDTPLHKAAFTGEKVKKKKKHVHVWWWNWASCSETIKVTVTEVSPYAFTKVLAVQVHSVFSVYLTP